MKKGMDVTIMGHRGWVEYIKGQAPLEPWYKESLLSVFIELDAPGLPVAGFGLHLPLKEYEPDELKALIEQEGSAELKKIIQKHEEEDAKRAVQEEAKRDAEAIARKVAEATGIELLEERR